jgi:hypothetical protein
VRAERMPSSSQRELLERVIERIQGHRRASATPPLTVFDLDGTLLDNRPRTLAILRELGEQWANRCPGLAERLQRTDADEIVYLVSDNLRRFGVTDDELLGEALAFWKERFFTDRFLFLDRPLPGARDFARACHEAGATLVYFSGRDLPNMALGTFASLRDLGFPIGGPGTELVLKSDPGMGDFDFKRAATPELGRSGTPIAAFDNEPLNCNIFRARFPEAHVFLLDTQHLPGAPELDDRVTVIESFVR